MGELPTDVELPVIETDALSPTETWVLPLFDIVERANEPGLDIEPGQLQTRLDVLVAAARLFVVGGGATAEELKVWAAGVPVQIMGGWCQHVRELGRQVVLDLEKALRLIEEESTMAAKGRVREVALNAVDAFMVRQFLGSLPGHSGRSIPAPVGEEDLGGQVHRRMLPIFAGMDWEEADLPRWLYADEVAHCPNWAAMLLLGLTAQFGSAEWFAACGDPDADPWVELRQMEEAEERRQRFL